MSVTDTDFLHEVHEGLSRPQKSLHPKWLYDRKGSEIFEEITDVPEYYPTRTEAKIFPTAFAELAERLWDIRTVVEYGAGAIKKIAPLIEAVEPQTYLPIDISEDFLKASAEEIQAQFPSLRVVPIVGDFTSAIELPEGIGTPSERLGFFPGSTISNFEPGTSVPFLERVRTSLGEGSHFLISGDLIKDRAVLEAAYDDAGGVTAAFNLNLLDRMNRELGANFDRSAFAHKAIWNDEKSRIEMHLVALSPQTVTIGGRDFSFVEGETLHTENSYKYTVDGFEAMAGKAGWRLDSFWTDEDDLFGVFLLAA